MKSLAWSWLPLALWSAAAPLVAAEHRITSASDLNRITPSLQPGDNVLLAAGTWRDQALTFRATGTAGEEWRWLGNFADGISPGSDFRSVNCSRWSPEA